MATFIGEIKLFAGNFVPRGWLLCQGQVLEIASNGGFAGLAGLLGAYYGGNGTTTFGLPDLRGRTPIGTGNGPGLSSRVLGQMGGSEDVALQQTQIPAHQHIISNTPTVTNNLTVDGSATLKCSSTVGNTTDPSNAFPSKPKAVGGDNIYTTAAAAATSTMNSAALDVTATLQGGINVAVDSQCGLTGNGLEHENMQPWIGMNYIINFDGVFPQHD